MKTNSNAPLVGQILDETAVFSIQETQHICAISSGRLMSLVAEGVVEPKNPESARWLFDGFTVTRAIKAVRLQRELEIDWSAIALVLDLLEKVDSLQRQLLAQSELDEG